MDKKTERYVINLLRQGTVKYWGRTEALKRARKRFLIGRAKNGRPKFKWKWKCVRCNKWYEDETDVEVDHIDEVGPYLGDLHEYAVRMFNFEGNSQILCIKCHKGKTEAAAPLRWERKKKEG